VKVLFFGRVRELAGHREEAQELPEGATIADLFERYTRRFPDLAGFRSSLVASRLGTQSLLMATKSRSSRP
jgi:molybdopterin converting factor small subunit